MTAYETLMEAPARRFAAVGEAVVDWEFGCIYRTGEAIRLEPRVAALLRRLAQSPGETVTKDELVRDVWNGTHVVDEAIMRAVSLLRTALGDDPKRPVYIETVPKRGYRLITFPRPVASLSQRRRGRGMGMIGAAAAMLLTFAGGYATAELVRPSSPPPVRAINLDSGEVTEIR